VVGRYRDLRRQRAGSLPKVAKVVLDEDKKRMDVVVPDEQLSLAIGRRGQNVRLASHAYRLGYRHPDGSRGIGTPREEFKTRSALFIEALDVDDVIAHLLVAEGFATVEELAAVILVYKHAGKDI
jgi:N utilization substance protein A